MNVALVLTALDAAARLAVDRQAKCHEREMTALRNEGCSLWVEAMFSNRVREVKSAFSEILRDFSAQAAGLLEQRSRLVDRQLDNQSVSAGLRIRKEINDIDLAMRSIRADCGRLYDRMTHVILAMGDQMPPLDSFIPQAQIQTLAAERPALPAN